MTTVPHEVLFFSIITKLLPYLQVDDLMIQRDFLVIQNKKCENSLALWSGRCSLG